MRGVVGFCRERWRSLVVVVLTLATVGFAGWVYYNLYGPDQQVDAAATATAKEAAEDGTIAVLSYSPDSLTEDIATAKSHLTGDFLTYYTHFTDQIFASAAKQQQVTTTARVIRAAVYDMRADSAVVLLFVNKESSSKANPAPETKAATVRATMKKVDGSWLIAQFEPL
jgi:Mce-associated membrane protein